MTSYIKKQIKNITEKTDLLEKIKDEGLLTGLKLDIYEIISENHGLTVGELAAYYKKRYPRTDRGRNELAKRVTELQQMGAIRTEGKIICSRSGRQAAVFVVTQELPDRSLLPTNVAKAVAVDDMDFSTDNTSGHKAAFDYSRANESINRRYETVTDLSVAKDVYDGIAFLGSIYSTLLLIQRFRLLFFFIPGFSANLAKKLDQTRAALRALEFNAAQVNQAEKSGTSFQFWG